MKTLIAFSTKHGITQKYAEEIAKHFSGEVTLVNLQKQPDIDVAPYDRVVVGACIYAGQVQKVVKDFCAKNLDVLKTKQLGFYISCMFEGEQADTQLQTAYPADLLGQAVAKAHFGGVMNLAKMNMLERLAVRVVAKTKETVSHYSEESARKFAQNLQQGA